MIETMSQLDEAIELGKGVLFLSEVDQDIYRQHPALSQSELKVIADRTPRHLSFQRSHAKISSDEMKLGTIAHMAILEPDRFREKVMVPEPVNKRTKAGKEQFLLTESAARAENKLIVSQEQYDQAVSIKAEICTHPIASMMLTGGVAERASFGKLYELDVKILTDYYRPQNHEIIDIKTTRCASINEFERDLRKFRYHWQACWYSDLIEKITGELPTFKIIAIENTPPHCIAIFEIKFDLMAIARREIMDAVEKLTTARVSGWDGYPLGTQEISAHKWEWDKFKGNFQDA